MKFKLTTTKHTTTAFGAHAKVKEGIYRKSDPSRTWHLLLLGAGFLLLISLAFHFFLYVKINKGVPVAEITDTGAEKIDERKLSYILSYFKERAQTFEMEKLTRPVVSDPSL